MGLLNKKDKKDMTTCDVSGAAAMVINVDLWGAVVDADSCLAAFGDVAMQYDYDGSMDLSACEQASMCYGGYLAQGLTGPEFADECVNQTTGAPTITKEDVMA